MTSETDRAFAWAFLPGDTQPTLCALISVSQRGAGMQVTSFIYGRSYLATAGATALDPIRLPLADRSYKANGPADLFGVIADACPDDWGRYVINRRFGEQRYPVGYLLHSQEDRVGHLCFSRSPDEQPALADPPSRDLLDDAWAVVTGLDAGREIPEELAARVRPNTGMGGARPKLTVTDGAVQWLAKFPSQRDDRRYSQSRAEAAMLDLAALCGIRAAQCELQEVAATHGDPGGVVLLVRRFDRTRASDSSRSDGWLRDAYVSARTVLSSQASIRTGQYMGSYPQLAEQLQRWSARPAADRLELFRRMVFNCCVSNTDDHARNHGMLADEAGHLFRLAPAFDIVPRVHGTKLRHQSMNIGDRGAAATVENLLSAAAAFAIEAPVARQIVDEVQHGVATHWKACLQGRGMRPAEIALLGPCFEPLPVYPIERGSADGFATP